MPKICTCLREGYSFSQLLDDAKAGITVGLIALPLAMAFAIGSGVTPERGLYTAIIAGFLISLLGGSRVQIGGPTGAYVVLVYSVVQKHGIDGLILATFLAGALLVLMGLLRLGVLIRFIPYPVTTGFTAGIATVIFMAQIKDFCGFQIPTPDASFFGKCMQYVAHIDTINPYTIILSTLALAILIVLRRISKKIPGAVIALVITTSISSYFLLPVATIENSIGTISNALPKLAFPSFSLTSLQAVMPDAIAIALLGAIESLLSAVVADGMTGYRHHSNCELVGQGIANIGSSLFGGIPATGAIARTSANVQMGAKTPVAGMLHAVTLFLLMLFLAPQCAKLPLGALAAILMVVAYNMSELEHCKAILKGPASDRFVFLVTYALTVFIDLTFAVQIGMLLACFLFLKHMTEKTTICASTLFRDDQANEKQTELPSSIPNHVALFDLNGPFFFSVTDVLHQALRYKQKHQTVFILRCAHVPFVDASGIHALKQFHKQCKKQGIQFVLTEVRKDVQTLLQDNGVCDHVPIAATLSDALETARKFPAEVTDKLIASNIP